MKKTIYREITGFNANNSKIWRSPTNFLSDEFVVNNFNKPEKIIQADLDEWEDKSTTTTKKLEIFSRYYDSMNEFIFEYKFNDPEKYLRESDLTPFNEILKEFPERIAGWGTIMTNTGLVCFYKDSVFVIYDMFDDSETGTLQSIKPDISMMLEYNFIDQPLNIRKINFTDNKFIPDRSFVNGSYYAFYNCDGIDGWNFDEDNFYFVKASREDVTKINFNYKPVFVFKIYNTDGSEKTGNLEIIVAGKEAEPYENNIYFADLSDYDKNNSDKTKVSIQLSNCGSGYLEVI